jgi:hypothetical protein
VIPLQTLPTAAAPPVFPPAGHIRIALDAGQHPATARPLLAESTCGDCIHRTSRAASDGKPRSRCGLAVSRRGGPDVHPTYPGCDQHQAAA